MKKILALSLIMTVIGFIGLVQSTSTIPNAKAQELSLPIPAKEIYLRGEVTMGGALRIADQIKEYNTAGANEIVIYITSPGGDVYAGLVIYDAMEQSKAKIRTVCQGYCMSMAATILASGDIRQANASATIMFHELSTTISGKVKDMQQELDEAARLQEVINQRLSQHTKLPVETIRKILSYDHFMSPEEAQTLHLIDEVITPTKGA